MSQNEPSSDFKNLHQEMLARSSYQDNNVIYQIWLHHFSVPNFITAAYENLNRKTQTHYKSINHAPSQCLMQKHLPDMQSN